MGLVHVQTKRFTVDEFTRLWELGAFGHERMELIEGEIVPMSPQGEGHSEAILHGNEVLVLALHDTHYVGVQLPLKLSEYSGPEPDFFITPKIEPRVEQVTGKILRKADLVIEVAVSSLEYDRDEKASLYARYGVKDYWILNVVERQLEVHRDPVPMPDRIFGHGYASVEIYPGTAAISPMVRPDVLLRAADLL